MAVARSLLADEPSKEDYERADEFIRWANSRDGISPERRQALLEFREQIARTYKLSADRPDSLTCRRLIV